MKGIGKLTGFIFAGVAAISILSTNLAMAAPPADVCVAIVNRMIAAGVDPAVIIRFFVNSGCGA